jgi:hypothetical protein
MRGKQRPLLELPGSVVLMDVFRDGRVLVQTQTRRRELNGIIDGEPRERDFSWLDWTFPNDITPDGKTFLFHESGVGGGKDFKMFLRNIDGSPPVLMGAGNNGVFSPDAKKVLNGEAHSPAQLFLYPVGPGQTRQVTNDVLDHADFAWMRDGTSLIFFGSEPGHAPRFYLQDLEGGRPKPISPEGFDSTNTPLSSDGKYLVVNCQDRLPCLFPIAGGEPRPIPGVGIEDSPIQWTADGKSIFMFRAGAMPANVERVDIQTGKRTPWKSLAPADRAGVHGVTVIKMTPDARVCLYSYLRTFSDLYLVSGLK